MSEKSIAVSMTEETKEKVWGNIVANINKRNEKKEGEITILEFAEMLGISLDYARKKMNALIQEGKVTWRWFTDGQYRRVKLYLPVDEA